MTGPTKKNRTGRSVAAARAIRDWTRDDLVAAMNERGHGWTPMTVTKIERGHRRVSTVEAADLADSLGVPADWIVNGPSWPGIDLVWPTARRTGELGAKRGSRRNRHIPGEMQAQAA